MGNRVSVPPQNLCPFPLVPHPNYCISQYFHVQIFSQFHATISQVVKFVVLDICSISGLSFSLQIYKKLGSIKLRPPILATKILWHPHHRYTLPPKQAKIVLKSVFQNKINTLCDHLVTPYILVIKKILWTPFFSFPKFMNPLVYLGTPLLKKMIAPLI